MHPRDRVIHSTLILPNVPRETRRVTTVPRFWGPGRENLRHPYIIARDRGLTKEHRQGYYFYLVFFGTDGKPAELLAVLAEQLYPKAEMTPSSYEVRFDRREVHKTKE